MTHEELREAATGIANMLSEHPAMWTKESCRDAIQLARAYLAGGWRTDFENCPVGRKSFLYYSDGEVLLLDYANIKRYLAERLLMDYPTHWAEFIPPTTRKEGAT